MLRQAELGYAKVEDILMSLLRAKREARFSAPAEVLMDATPGVAEQLIAVYEQTGKTVLGGITTSDPEDFRKYAYAGGEEEEGLLKINKIIEKPGAGNAPSNLAILAGFLFTPDIFDALRRAGERTKEGAELVYVDGINVMLEEGKSVYAHEIKDYEYFDCGSKIGYLKAVVEVGLKHEDVNEEFKTYLKNLQV